MSPAAPDPARPSPPRAACPLCGSKRLHYLFSVGGARVVRCQDCTLMLRDRRADAPRPAAAPTLAAPASLPAAPAFDLLARYRPGAGGRLLSFARGGSPWPAEAVRRGFGVADAELANPIQGNFDVAALDGALDAEPDPAGFLRRVRARLAPGGTLLVAARSFEAWSAPRRRRRWPDAAAADRCFYFTRATLETLLLRAGFGEIIARTGRDAPGGGPDGMVFLARRREETFPEKLSLVVPVFNEARTFAANFDQLLAKRVEGLEIEIVVVESNSTDGTRGIVARYAEHPRVTVVWEDRPRGKGHAVRAGLAHLTGDYVLIQDADLEYDLEDYDALLEPLVQGQAAFVLGARHGGRAWKMRTFSGQPVLGSVLNGAHWFFTLLVNRLYGARLRDPFTMYKVFRRDCLCGLEFECDRFDFDFELVIKLLQKGYQPLEIPVNYRSRSFAEGKKVSFFRDPLTWLRALAKFRLRRLDPLENLARQRRGEAGL